MLFSRRKRKARDRAGVQDEIARKIVYRFLCHQVKLSTWMQRQAERLSQKAKTTLLVLFCLCASTYCIYLAGSNFISKVKPFYKVTSIQRLQAIKQAKDRAIEVPLFISEKEYKRIHRFAQYMDSLARSPSGSILYKRLLSSRPHLLDSVRLLQNLYQDQHKK